MSICRALRIIPRRAMATKITTPASTGGTDPKKIDQKMENALAKDGRSTKTEFVNYNDGVGHKQDPLVKDIFLNPLLTPPPRPPRTPDDFMNPERLGHWVSTGHDFTSPVADKYYYHEMLIFFICGGMLTFYLFLYSPDFRNVEWARREAFLRVAKREALGLPLIDRNIVDPDRVVLPTEEELEMFPYPVTL